MQYFTHSYLIYNPHVIVYEFTGNQELGLCHIILQPSIILLLVKLLYYKQINFAYFVLYLMKCYPLVAQI